MSAGAKTIKSRRHRCVRGEKISRARGRQRDVKRLAVRLHEAARPLQHRESRVAFVQVTHIWLDAEGLKQPPAADAKNRFLFEAQFRAAAIKARW